MQYLQCESLYTTITVFPSNQKLKPNFVFLKKNIIQTSQGKFPLSSQSQILILVRLGDINYLTKKNTELTSTPNPMAVVESL